MPDARMAIYLASTSARRIDLMRDAGYDFTVVEPPEDESGAHDDGTPEGQALARASFKARAAARGMASGLVIGADTVVSLGGSILGKPADRDDARSILRKLSGTTHRVITGVSIVNAATGRELARTVSTEIEMSPMTEVDIEKYVASGEADGKAGAYAIQETGDRFVRKVKGSFTNVVGLPMEALTAMLSEMREISDGRE